MSANSSNNGHRRFRPYYTTDHGAAFCADSRELLPTIPDASVDLVLTSPPFALQRKKAYGNVPASEYTSWFAPFVIEIHRILKPRGSFVLDIGGAWNRGEPTRSLYHFDLLLNLCKPRGRFRLAQEFYWHNPAKMPGPAQWVTIERVRVTDSVNPIWWLAKSGRPKASNRRVLKPYGRSMELLLERGYNAGPRPSGHVVSRAWGKRNKGAIPQNLITAANTRSSDSYMESCRELGLRVHPARFVREVPEFFVKFLTQRGDVVLDPFAGSNVVGAVCETLERNWIGVEAVEEYVAGSAFRFSRSVSGPIKRRSVCRNAKKSDSVR